MKHSNDLGQPATDVVSTSISSDGGCDAMHLKWTFSLLIPKVKDETKHQNTNPIKDLHLIFTCFPHIILPQVPTLFPSASSKGKFASVRICHLVAWHNPHQQTTAETSPTGCAFSSSARAWTLTSWVFQRAVMGWFSSMSYRADGFCTPSNGGPCLFLPGSGRVPTGGKLKGWYLI